MPTECMAQYKKPGFLIRFLADKICLNHCLPKERRTYSYASASFLSTQAVWTQQRTKGKGLRVCREERRSHSGEPGVTEKTETGAAWGWRPLCAGLSHGTD